MNKALGISFLLAIALGTAVQARPVDQTQGYRPEIPANPEPRTAVAAARGMTMAPAAICPSPDTAEYGGTVWAADSMRWEAVKDGMWTFSSGVGSAFGDTGPNKPAGYHTLMEGWYGIDQTLNPLPWFRRMPYPPGCANLSTSGSYCLWAGLTLAESQPLCYASGQGYGNNWNLEVRKTFAYGGTGNATLTYRYRNDSEDGWDYSYVTIDTSGTGGADDVELAAYTGVVGPATATITLTRGASLPSAAGNVIIKFLFQSDGSYSDQDGANPTTCGGVMFDDVSLTGALSDFTDFEGGMNGWSLVIPTTGVGDYSNIVDRNTALPAPLTFCACNVRDSVLVFYDELGQHPIDQDNTAASPWIDLKAGGDAGRPGKLIMYNIYAEMPLANYIFTQLRVRWYPAVCGPTGLVYTTGWRDNNIVIYYGEQPSCSSAGPVISDYSGVLAPSAEQVQLAVGVMNLCRGDPFGTPCTGVTNTTPWFDNIRLGVFGSSAVPNLTIGTFDFFQDNFATDGSLNPASPGRIDANTLKNASTPGPGSFLRDTLVARGDGGNTEVRLVFHVRPGPFTNAAALAARAALWTAEPGLGTGWYSARMDTAEQGGIKAASLTWMTCFHESDPAFAAIGGTDRTPDPTDPMHASNKDILPDNLFTPGSRIDYFVASRFLPGDPRNPGGVCQWYVVPDTSNGYRKEMEILPSSMGADSSWNCTLYVDHHGDRSLYDASLEEAGLTGSLGAGSNNAEGTRYDRFDNETPSSGQMSFGRPIRTVYGASIIQTFAYKNIVWHAGNLSSVQLTDEDANMLGPWLTLKGIGNNRFWGSGSGLATSMNGSGEPSTVSFMKNICGVLRTCNTLRDINCPSGSTLDSTYCLPTSAVAGSEFATTVSTNVRGNGCPDLESFDVINKNSSVVTAKGQLNYVKNTANVGFASVTNHNIIDVDYKTVIDGFAVGRARTTPADVHIPVLCTVTGASLTRADNILDWFATSPINCKIPTTINGVDDPITPKPPQFRAALGNAYPNPMNPTTRIQFTNGTEGGRVTLQIFDVTGRIVKTLVDSKMAAGPHSVEWDGTLSNGSSAPSGMYFYRMTGDNGGFTAARKLVLMK